MLMPHRVALALQADGWIVRQDLVWSKPNSMPESVRGWSFNKDGELRRGSWRHTRAHEYVFVLTKEMQYWSDQEAVREKHARIWDETNGGSWSRGIGDADRVAEQGKAGTHSGPYPLPNPAGRNPRSVLHIPTSPYKGAHYATYPPALIAPLILATCPRWACPVCGQGWSPVVEQQFVPQADVSLAKGVRGHDGQKAMDESSDWQGYPRGLNASQILGHRPTCVHEHTQAEAVPGICLDPFVGSGTSVMVAQQLLRRGIGFDISRPYLDEQAKLRTGSGTPSNALDNLPLFREEQEE